MAAVMLDRLGIDGVRDSHDAAFEDAVRYVRTAGRLYASIDRAVAVALERAHDASSSSSSTAVTARTTHRVATGPTDDASGRPTGIAAGHDDSVVRTAWWLYRARMAERLCMADLDPREFVEREDPLGVVVRACGPIAETRRAAHLYSLAYSAAGLARLFDRMQHVWADRVFGPDLAWIGRAGGPLTCVVARLALALRPAPPAAHRRQRIRRRSVWSHRAQRHARHCDDPEMGGGVRRDHAPQGTVHRGTDPPVGAVAPWPVAHMSLDFMDRLQAVINRRPLSEPRDAPLTPPFADQPDPWTPIDA
ncbi:hypothetical protein psal_cds_1265 [Pandoravirus salinus]|uniref:Uncharacterized protein n=1 Tax=Pandoravirus salinus TaxID=1349410 RepID=S4W5H8_9VIRU|nr:hypothetical protein psal_cds_1265 [Pandoravirus salinus]AGO85610.1 hypothetical protein psal_cds_1265 [Pandoravirus salinus]